jgi:RNA polymerase sigma factor (sigma-70 family)
MSSAGASVGPKKEATAEDAEQAVPFFDEETFPALDLHQALESLPPIHRECLALYYLEKRSIAQAAEVVGISESAFKVRLHRARNTLREVLTDRWKPGWADSVRHEA